MQNSDITDPLFAEAVTAIDTGNIPLLKDLLAKHPRLLHDRLDTPNEKGYFSNPHLLFFVADNPIRNPKLPANIVEVTDLLIQAARKEGVTNLQHQLDYTLGLVATGRIPRECGVQIALMDLLMDEGATPGTGHGALAHGNIAAAEHLLERGGKLTLTAAVCLDRMDDIMKLSKTATQSDLNVALMAAAFFGKPGMLSLLLGMGANPNEYLDSAADGFHAHATALHQAVYSGSFDAVKILVESGADLTLKDRGYGGTPLGWALYMQESEDLNGNPKETLAAITSYLQAKEAR
jgi:Ankyrin repeats (3 copies)